MTDTSNSDDVIDSRDVIERIEELREMIEDANAATDLETSETVTPADKPDVTAEIEELRVLEAFAKEGEGYAPDWEYGATIIRESYFADYCEELCKDIGDLPSNIPAYLVIDWEATALNLRVDYADIDFDGVTYLVR